MTVEPPSIRRAGPHQAGAILELLRECGRDLAAHGFRNWDPPPATEASIREETTAERVLVALSPEGAVLGTATLRRTPTHAYVQDVAAGRIRWTVAGDAAYLNRLAVHPALQRTGLGERLLRAAEEEARAAGAAALRCDVLAENAALLAWYRRRGYRSRGRRRHSGKDFVVLEARL